MHPLILKEKRKCSLDCSDNLSSMFNFYRQPVSSVSCFHFSLFSLTGLHFLSFVWLISFLKLICAFFFHGWIFPFDYSRLFLYDTSLLNFTNGIFLIHVSLHESSFDGPKIYRFVQTKRRLNQLNLFSPFLQSQKTTSNFQCRVQCYT